MSTPSIWFCQSGSPVATSVVMSPGTMLTSAALPFGFEASMESGPVGVRVATLSGAPLMKAPTLIVHVTDAPAARPPGREHVTVPLAWEQSDASGPPTLANVTSGGSGSLTVKAAELLADVFVTVIV